MPSAPCEACGAGFDVRASSCPRCGYPRGGPEFVPGLDGPIGARSPRTAMWLSLAWPGAGHLYLRDNEKGTILSAVSLVCLVLSAALIGATLGMLAWLGIALYAALDLGRRAASGSRAR